jgi:hypothetical protein
MAPHSVRFFSDQCRAFRTAPSFARRKVAASVDANFCRSGIEVRFKHTRDGLISAVGGFSSSRLRCADMPVIDQKDVSPDEAILLGHCPECGQLLIPKTAVAHASTHWFGRDPNDPWLSEEARRRYKLIIDFAAARYNPALEERESHHQGVPMSGPNGNSSTSSTTFSIIAEVAIAGIVEAAMWTLVGDLPRSVLWATVIIGSIAILAINFREHLTSYRVTFTLTHLMVVLLTSSVLSIPLYGVVRWAVWPADERLAPFAANSRFFEELPTDAPGTFTMICYPFDTESPSSCEIALSYQTALGKYWRPGDFIFVETRPNFKGISILTQPNVSNGALKLRQHFRSIGIDPEFRPADPSVKLVGPDDFAVWIGGRP